MAFCKTWEPSHEIQFWVVKQQTRATDACQEQCFKSFVSAKPRISCFVNRKAQKVLSNIQMLLSPNAFPYMFLYITKISLLKSTNIFIFSLFFQHPQNITLIASTLYEILKVHDSIWHLNPNIIFEHWR